MWLDKWLKRPVWDDPSTGNMGNGPKHWFNLNGISFTIFVDHCEKKWVGKSHLQWHAKSSDVLLRHWLPMTSILFLVETIQCKQFRRIYLKNKKLFVNLCMHFWNLRQILTIFKERWPSWFIYFRNYGPRKTWLDKCLKCPVWDVPWRGNVVNRSKHWFNLNSSYFTMFVDHCERNWVGKSNSYRHAKS